MPVAKARDYRSLSQNEIIQKISDLSKSLLELKQKQVSGQLEKPHEFKLYRRQIAQLKTVEKEKRNVSQNSRKK